MSKRKQLGYFQVSDAEVTVFGIIFFAGVVSLFAGVCYILYWLMHHVIFI